MTNHSRPPRRSPSPKLEILFEDRDIIVINKSTGLLTWSPHRDQMQTAERILTHYLRKGSSRSRLRALTVHRLDRETSGLLVFAKSEQVQQQIKGNWCNTDKRYFAVVHGQLKHPAATLTDYLIEDQDQFVHVTKNEQVGKRAESQYKVLSVTPKYSSIEVRLLTGRKNQIRVQFSHAGHPIVGDRKYGRTGDRFARMALHATHLEFNHPFSGRRMVFDASIPDCLLQLASNKKTKPASEYPSKPWK